MANYLRILIVDDHAIVRQGLKFILADEFQDAAFGEAQNGVELFKHLRQQVWDIAILDINMPGRSGLDLLKDIKNEYPRLPVLILSVHSEDQYAIRVLKAGGAGYLTKDTASDDLVKAVRKVLGGGKYISAEIAEKLVTHIETDRSAMPHEALSDREFEVLCSIASGKTLTEIALDMLLSVKTISTFRTRILNKMHMRNNSELTHYAIENGLLN